MTNSSDIATFRAPVTDPTGLPITCEPFPWQNSGLELTAVCWLASLALDPHVLIV